MQGGGSRIADICRYVAEAGAELVALTEFRTINETALRDGLGRLGYRFVMTSNPADGVNGLLVASQSPLSLSPGVHRPRFDRERWLPIRMDYWNLEVLVVHIPGAPDNKFADGYGISGAKRKELLWDHTARYAGDRKHGRTILVGDFNTGLRADTEGGMFKLSHYVRQLLDEGYVDTWRHLHPEGRDFTWYSKRKDKPAGVAEDLHGFRLDYIFAAPQFVHAIDDSVIMHAPRTDGTSDHAIMVADIDVGECNFGYSDYLPDAEAPNVAASPVAAETLGLATHRELPRRRHVSPAARDPYGRIRIDLAPGTLPDMTCGRDGTPFQQEFRPAYITAVWSGLVLTELRIWGPRVLKNGSLGSRELDHIWKSAPPGGVRHSDLPAAVVELLRAHDSRSTIPQRRSYATRIERVVAENRSDEIRESAEGET